VTLAGALGFGAFSYTLNRDECGEGCERAGISLKLSNTIGDGLGIASVVTGVTALILYLGSDEPVAPAGERAGASRPGRPVVGLGAGPNGIQISVGGAF
jgi:hypothetical protein